MPINKDNPIIIFSLWDELDLREQATLMSEFKKHHPGGFTRDDLLAFLQKHLPLHKNRNSNYS